MASRAIRSNKMEYCSLMYLCRLKNQKIKYYPKYMDFNYIDANVKPEGKILTHYPVFCISPYKAGSTMLFCYLKDILNMLEVTLIDYPTYFHHYENNLNLFYQSKETAPLYKFPYFYVGHRELPSSIKNENWPDNLSMFAMIRNPKDCLVSMYYSFLGSHTAPLCLKDKDSYELEKNRLRSNINIDDYVVNCSTSYLENLKNILATCNTNSKHTLILYEDVIFNKRKMVDTILKAVEDATGNPILLSQYSDDLKEIEKKYDIIPQNENPDKHIRQVHPGNWKQKLSSNSISFLNKTFGPTLSNLYKDLLDD